MVYKLVSDHTILQINCSHGKIFCLLLKEYKIIEEAQTNLLS